MKKSDMTVELEAALKAAFEAGRASVVRCACCADVTSCDECKDRVSRL